MKLPVLIGMEAAKAVSFIWCGCVFNTDDNWFRQAILDPYSWYTPSATTTSFVAGPYSPIWYLLNQPMRYGYIPLMTYFLAVDTLFSLFIFTGHGWKYIIPYIGASYYFFQTDPIDFFLFLFSLLGAYHWGWSLFAILYKLPWPGFAPTYVFSFILNNPYGVNEPDGMLRYILLGSAWLGSAILYMRRRKLKVAGQRG